MPIDPRIALGFQAPQMPDFGELASRRLQMANMMRDMRAADQEAAQQNALAQYIQSGKAASDPRGLLAFGLPGLQAMQGITNLRNLELNERETAARLAEQQRQRQESLLATGIMRGAQDPSDANLDNIFADLEEAGINTSNFRQMFGQVPDVEARRKYLTDFLETTPEGRAMNDRYKSVPTERNLGNRIEVFEGNTLRPDAGRVISTYALGVSPDQASRAAIAQDEAERERAAIARVFTNPFGNVTAINRFGAGIPIQNAPPPQNDFVANAPPAARTGGFSPLRVTPPPAAGAPIGKPSAAQEKATQAKTERVNQITNALDSLIELTVPDPKTGKSLLEQAPGGGLQAAVLTGTRFFNIPTTMGQAQSSVEPLAGPLLQNIPRFEGPQSDKDVQEYRQQAGNLTDPDRSTNEKLAAARTMFQLNIKYAAKALGVSEKEILARYADRIPPALRPSPKTLTRKDEAEALVNKYLAMD